MRIKDVLKEKGLKQQDLAEKMGISLSAVKQMLGADIQSGMFSYGMGMGR